MSKKTVLQLVPIDAITTAGNTRHVHRDVAFDELVADIKARDIQSPPRARKVGDALVLTFGHRRLEAAKVAGMTHVPLLIDEGPLSEGDRHVLQLTENLHRSNLNPVEFADAVARLIQETQWSPVDVAEQLNTSASRISRALALAHAPGPIRNAILDSGLGADLAYQLTLVKDEAEQARLLDDALHHSVNRDGIARQAKALRKATLKQTNDLALAVAETARTKVSRATAFLGGECSVTVTGHDLTFERFRASLKALLALCRKSRGLELSTFLKMTRDQARQSAAAK